MARCLACLFALIAVLSAQAAPGQFIPFALSGQTFVHDPSTIIDDRGVYHVFSTGPGIRVKSSTNLIYWQESKPVFDRPPAWTQKAVPGFHGYFWAPDIIHVDGKFLLYYAVSTWGKPTSAIGLATNPTLNPAAPDYHWSDAGKVISSTHGSRYNAIDPSVMLDKNGKLWLAFGSYWDGIFLVELNPDTGKPISHHAPLYQLAWNPSIEASCLTRHGKYYYLFVNWGRCCRGTNSTYQVRVGRSTKVTGPYLDRHGRNMATGGGSLFLKSTGPFIGPGHIGILHDHGTTWFSYHYYDANTQGRSRLGLGKLSWVNGWPVPVNDAPHHWKLVWHDEFNTNGAPNPANWGYEHGFVRNHELQWYQPQNAVCTNGCLVIEARRTHQRNPDYVPGSHDWRTRRKWINYTSAALTSRHRQQFKYGKIEMRARIDTRSGSWPAFWALGAAPGIQWPACGEIDMMEYYTGEVLANIGWQQAGHIKWLSVRKPLRKLGGVAWSRQFHTWTMIWDSRKIELFLDDRLMNYLNLSEMHHPDEGNPFRRPFYLLLNQAIGGDSGGDPAATQFPVKFEVDWVRAYQAVPKNSCAR